MNECNTLWLDIIKKERMIFDLEPLLTYDYAKSTENFSEYVVYYSAKYKDTNFIRYQAVWFSSKEELLEIVLYHLPSWYICDLDRLSVSTEPGDHVEAFQTYFKDPDYFIQWCRLYKAVIPNMIASNNISDLTHLMKFFFPYKRDHLVTFNVEFIGTKEDLLTTDEEPIRHLRNEMRKDFIKPENEWHDDYCLGLYVADFIQQIFENQINFLPFLYNSYTQLHNLEHIDPIAENMIKRVFTDYINAVDSQFMKNYILENYVNLKRYK
jgi:hypothetical protein